MPGKELRCRLLQHIRAAGNSSAPGLGDLALDKILIKVFIFSLCLFILMDYGVGTCMFRIPMFSNIGEAHSLLRYSSFSKQFI